MTVPPRGENPEAGRRARANDPRPRSDTTEELLTGVPGLDSWAKVYVVGLGALALWIALLTLFMRAYS